MTAYEAKDYPTALGQWLPLADGDDPRVHYWLGIAYRFGEGIPQDYAKALIHLKKAGSQTADGNIYRRALYSLGYMAEEGQGMKADMEKAECLYRTSAENGYANAQYALALQLRLKPGISSKSLDWIERAALQGNPLSLFRLGQLALWNPFKEQSEGYRLLVIAANRGSKDAIKLLDETSNSNDKETINALQKGRRQAPDWSPVEESIPKPLVPVPDDCWP